MPAGIFDGGMGTVMAIVIVIVILWLAGVFPKKEGIDVRAQANRLSGTYDTGSRVLGRGWSSH
jgi:hypothetical protein